MSKNSQKKFFEALVKTISTPKNAKGRSGKGYARGGRAGGTASKQKGASR